MRITTLTSTIARSTALAAIVAGAVFAGATPSATAAELTGPVKDNWIWAYDGKVLGSCKPGYRPQWSEVPSLNDKAKFWFPGGQASFNDPAFQQHFQNTKIPHTFGYMFNAGSELIPANQTNLDPKKLYEGDCIRLDKTLPTPGTNNGNNNIIVDNHKVYTITSRVMVQIDWKQGAGFNSDDLELVPGGPLSVTKNGATLSFDPLTGKYTLTASKPMLWEVKVIVGGPQQQVLASENRAGGAEPAGDRTVFTFTADGTTKSDWNVPPYYNPTPVTRFGPSSTTAAPAAPVSNGPLALRSSASAPISSSYVAGPNRYATSAVVAATAYPQGADTVYVARGDVFADALAGGSLSDGPVLLVNSANPAISQQAINEINPDKVIALGGPSAVSQTTLNKVAGGRQTSRIAGASRFDTAAAISRHAFPRGTDQAFLTNGMTMADAVGAGTLKKGPLLAVPATGQMPASVKAELQRLNPNTVTALGSTGALSDAMLNNAGTAGSATTNRVGGASRYKTSLNVAKSAYPAGSSPKRVYIARGDLFADAVSGSSFKDGPMILINPAAGPDAEVQAYLRSINTTQVVALGGSSSVPQKTLTAYQAAAK